MSEEKVLFSKLALGARFKYEGGDKVWVKIGVRPEDGCIAQWDDELQDKRWIGQPICCLNDTGEDMAVILVR